MTQEARSCEKEEEKKCATPVGEKNEELKATAAISISLEKADTSSSSEELQQQQQQIHPIAAAAVSESTAPVLTPTAAVAAATTETGNESLSKSDSGYSELDDMPEVDCLGEKVVKEFSVKEAFQRFDKRYGDSVPVSLGGTGKEEGVKGGDEEDSEGEESEEEGVLCFGEITVPLPFLFSFIFCFEKAFERSLNRFLSLSLSF